MGRRVTGTFDVKISRITQEPFPDGNELGRYSLDKRYYGDLRAIGKGEMLTATTWVDGSAAYVAMERVHGALGGRRGTFVLQHLGSMVQGVQQLTIAVVPDSGSGELVGLTGKLEISVDDGKHYYDLEYLLPATP